MPESIKLQADNLHQANWQQIGQDTLPVLSVGQIRELESAAFEQIDSFLLMQAAGIRSALKIADELAHHKPYNMPCVVLAGPGNNGGDACIVAGELKRQGWEVELFLVSNGKSGSKNSIQAKAWAQAQGVQPFVVDTNLGNLPKIMPNTVVVDGLLGIGCEYAPTGAVEGLIKHVNHAVAHINHQAQHLQVWVYALDCPSGLNCDTGLASGVAIHAHTTLTYLGCKHGLLTGHGKSLAGKVWVDDLNCGPLLTQLFTQHKIGNKIESKSQREQLERLPARRHEHHKGSFGSIAILGGQQGMVGASVLSARTALMLGSGRVALSLLCEIDMHLPDVQRQGQTVFLDMLFPEIMNKAVNNNLEFADTAVLGPGVGQSAEALELLLTLLEHNKGLNLVWDADAINLLATHSELQLRFKHYRNKHPTKSMVLTPHPLEAARLLKSTVETVQADRASAAKAISKQFDAIVVLKGVGTLIAQADRLEINTTGGPALSTAGSGDVLAGAIAAMMGQGLNGFDAAAFAVYLHGLSVQATHKEQEGLLTSHGSEIALRMKLHLNHLLNQSARSNGQLP